MFYCFGGVFILTQRGFINWIVGWVCIIVGFIIYFACQKANQSLKALHGSIFTEKIVREKFIQHDTDQSGTLDRSELENLCNDIGSSLNHHEVEAALFILDENNDGVIDMNEFLSWFHNRDITM